MASMVKVLSLVLPNDGTAGFAWVPEVDFEQLPLSILAAASLMFQDMVTSRLREKMQGKPTTGLTGPEANVSAQLAEELKRRRNGGVG